MPVGYDKTKNFGATRPFSVRKDPLNHVEEGFFFFEAHFYS